MGDHRQKKHVKLEEPSKQVKKNAPSEQSEPKPKGSAEPRLKPILKVHYKTREDRSRFPKPTDGSEEDESFNLHQDPSKEEFDVIFAAKPKSPKPRPVVGFKEFKPAIIPFRDRFTSVNIQAVDYGLLEAVSQRDLNGVKEAIFRGANVNSFKDLQTPLLIAAEYSDRRIVHYLLTVPGVDVDFSDSFGQTALLIAVIHGSLEIVKDLLANHADVNSPDRLGRTPLHMALFIGRPDIVKVLIAYDADVNAADCFGERPLYMCVVVKPNIECIGILLASGANPEFRHFTGMTLLSRAIFHLTPIGALRKLITFGANINSQDMNAGRTPLHIAAIVNNVEVAQLLIQNGANPNLKTSYRQTPYELAIFYESFEVAEFLQPLTKGAKLKPLQVLRKTKKNYS